MVIIHLFGSKLFSKLHRKHRDLSWKSDNTRFCYMLLGLCHLPVLELGLFFNCDLRQSTLIELSVKSPFAWKSARRVMLRISRKRQQPAWPGQDDHIAVLVLITMSLFALSSPQSHIYTPQRHHRYAPQTPSPLRTSRNANLMLPPTTPASTVKATPDSKSSRFSFATPTSTISTGSTSNSGSTPQSTSTSTSALPFQFQNRSRSQSPQATLAKSNAAAKTRRSSVFLDKVRQKREDSRFETRGEQALRMDFVRERRAWEERLKRRAPSFGVEVDDTMVDDVDEEMQDRGAWGTANRCGLRLTVF
jgi:hypothetical protein